MSKEKARYFTFLLYPDSIPEDWISRLESTNYPIAISPLHDKDVSAVEGQKYKKPHYHVIYITPNPVTHDAVRKRIQRLLGSQSVAQVQIISSAIENVYLYLTHESKDAIAKNKQVYDKADIKHLNNFDIDRYVTLDITEKNDILDLIIELTLDNGFENIVDLMDFYFKRGEEYGLPNIRVFNEIIKSNTGFLRLYFDGNYQRHQRNEEMARLKNRK